MHDSTKRNPLYLHTGFGNFIIFPVVVTTAAEHTQKKKIYQELNNKTTTNCRWNNFENVVHSLNIINDSCEARESFKGELELGMPSTAIGNCAVILSRGFIKQCVRECRQTTNSRKNHTIYGF